MTDCLTISDETITRAVSLLRAGRLVAFPTETVYGLGADATNSAAVARIFAAKNRPDFNPLISHVASVRQAFELGDATPAARILADAFWPGPLTLVLHRQPDCPVARLTTAGLDKLAVRVPAHDGARRLLQAFDRPVAAPSANPSGRISPSRADHVVSGLGDKVDLVLDAGACESGLESTIVDCTGAHAIVLRPGGVTRDELATALNAAGLSLGDRIGAPVIDNLAPSSPGQLESHYAPQNHLRMNAGSAAPGEEFIGFGPVAGSGKLALNLSLSGDLNEAAANLFDMLHTADALSDGGIAVAPVPVTGLGEAINDRLCRAAAPRPT